MTTTLLEYMKDYQRKPWWSHVINAPFKAIGWCVNYLTNVEENESVLATSLDPINLPKKERRVVKFFSENIIVDVDKKTLKTEISLEMQDPKVVYAVMEAVIENLKQYMTEYRSSKSRQDVDNLTVICELRKSDYYKAQHAYANYVDSNKNVNLQSAQVERERLQQEMSLAYQVYSQVATQLEGARIQAEQAKPVFAIVQPPVVPLRKTAPSKAKMLIIFAFLAGCCAAVWALFGDQYIETIREIF